MKAMKWIFDVFSRRAPSNPEPSPAFSKPLPPTFRNRVLMYCRDLFINTPMGDYAHQFWTEVHGKLVYRHGTPVLSQRSQALPPAEDALNFLWHCSDEYFLDFVEYIFRVDTFFRASQEEAEVVAMINQFFRLDDLPYALTDFVYAESVESNGYLLPQAYPSRNVEAYPQVIRRDSEVLHVSAIEPALHLLQKPGFISANGEFLAALDDYRKGDYGDCLVKCGSAFESVLKVLCDQNGWPYDQKHTASTLLKTVVSRTSLDTFFEQPLILIATIRNRLSTAHGAGTQSKTVARYIARYAINATASAILLITDAAM